MKSYPSKVKAVFFDMDGTVIDSELFYFKAWERALKPFQLHFTAEEWLRKMAGNTTAQVFEILSQDYGLAVDWESFLSGIKTAVLQQYQEDQVNLMPGVEELLQVLSSQQIRIALVTSSYREVAEKHLQNLGIRGFFEFLVTRDDVEKPKPNPEPYLLALSKMTINKDEAIVLEDSVPGVHAALSAGIFCVAVQSHEVLREQLFHADQVLKNLDEFQKVFSAAKTES